MLLTQTIQIRWKVALKKYLESTFKSIVHYSICDLPVRGMLSFCWRHHEVHQSLSELALANDGVLQILDQLDYPTLSWKSGVEITKEFTLRPHSFF